MVYDWKRNMPVRAQDAGEYLEELEQEHGSITPKLLLDKSRNSDALLHKCFEWNDDIAAEKYRESQAGFIIRNLVVVSVEKENDEAEQQEVRAFVNVTKEDGKSFVSIKTALNDEKMFDEVLQCAIGELKVFRQKYNNLKQLTKVFHAIDDVLCERKVI